MLNENEIQCFLNDYGIAELFENRNILKFQLKNGENGFTVRYAAPEVRSFISSFQILKALKPGPEARSDGVVTNKADIYAFSILTFET